MKYFVINTLTAVSIFSVGYFACRAIYKNKIRKQSVSGSLVIDHSLDNQDISPAIYLQLDEPVKSIEKQVITKLSVIVYNK